MRLHSQMASVVVLFGMAAMAALSRLPMVYEKRRKKKAPPRRHRHGEITITRRHFQRHHLTTMKLMPPMKRDSSMAMKKAMRPCYKKVATDAINKEGLLRFS